MVPDAIAFPEFDENLRDAFREETELFVDSLIREDRSVLDLLGADYTFANERLATHYGIPNVYGSHFRRVTLDPELARHRGGIFGHGSLLTVTSYPNRTSPVLRGKWMLTNVLGTPPAPPPADVPDLPERGEDGRAPEYYDRPTVRAITRAAADTDYRWSSIIVGIVKSSPFRMRRSES